jgi:predicted ester cyclase
MPHNRGMPTRAEVVHRYREYLSACNRRAWDERGSFLADSVLVNGVIRSRSEYVADIVRTTATFLITSGRFGGSCTKANGSTCMTPAPG